MEFLQPPSAFANQPICRHCALPIQEGQPRWTAHEPEEFWHYHCAEEAGLSEHPAFIIPTAPSRPF